MLSSMWRRLPLCFKETAAFATLAETTGALSRKNEQSISLFEVSSKKYAPKMQRTKWFGELSSSKSK